MKVLHMISGGDSGGAKTHVFALMRALPKYCGVKIVCFIKGQFFDELQDIDVPSMLLEQKNRFDLSVVDKIVEICKNDGVQIIHAHGARANFIAADLKRKIKIPVVSTVHSDYLLDFDSLYKKIVFTTLNTLALKKLDYHIGVSSNFKDMLISRGFNPNRVFTVYNGMDYSSPMTFCSKEEFAKRVGIEYNPDITYVGLIGRHDYVKGHDVFVDAAAKVLERRKNVVFLIAGDGDGRDELVKRVNDLGISDNFIFAGFVKDIYSFLNFVDINTLSSRCESFPYVLLEGARMKKPTVSSAVGGIPDLIRNGVTGLTFESQNSSDFADKLCTLIDDKALAEKYGNALYELATGNFSNDSLARTHAEIYSSILRYESDKKKSDAVISGYYGYNNSGDDALLYGMIKSLRALMPDIRLTVLSKNPEQTKRRYRVDAVKRFNPFAVSHALSCSHMLINGGGSLIQDATSFKSLMYYLSVIKAAKKRGLHVFVYANGIGPLKDSSLKYASKILSVADIITLREKESQAQVDRLGIKGVPVYLSADPALLLDAPDEKQAAEMLEKYSLPERNSYIAVSVRPWDKNDAEFEQKIAELCDYMYEKHALNTVLLPMKPQSDLTLCESIGRRAKCKTYTVSGSPEVSEIMAIISAARAVVGMRLHTLCYALVSCVPCVGIKYDPKIDGFLNYIGIDSLVNASDIDLQKLISLTENAVCGHDAISAKMKDRRAELRDLANLSARLAVEMIKSDFSNKED